MSVLFSELLIPGWAEGEGAMIGLDAVTGNMAVIKHLPCHVTLQILKSSSQIRAMRLHMPRASAAHVR